jgi:hypothetical protein
MKNDLDRLMKERGLDAIVVMGKMNGNLPLYYISNGAKVIRARPHAGIPLAPLGNTPAELRCTALGDCRSLPHRN